MLLSQVAKVLGSLADSLKETCYEFYLYPIKASEYRSICSHLDYSSAGDKWKSPRKLSTAQPHRGLALGYLLCLLLKWYNSNIQNVQGLPSSFFDLIL